MLPCKGHSWVVQEPLLLLPGCHQLHGASLHPGLESEGPLSLPQDASSLHCFLWGELPDPMECTRQLHGTYTLLYSLAATGHLLHQAQDSRTLKCVSKQHVLHVNTDRYQSTAAVQPGFFAEGGDVHDPRYPRWKMIHSIPRTTSSSSGCSSYSRQPQEQSYLKNGKDALIKCERQGHSLRID